MVVGSNPGRSRCEFIDFLHYRIVQEALTNVAGHAQAKQIRRDGHGSLNELNITPLLVLVFVLLVICIITTPQLTNSLEINLPSGKPPAAKSDAPKPKINRIVVDDRGQAFLNREPFTIPVLRPCRG